MNMDIIRRRNPNDEISSYVLAIEYYLDTIFITNITLVESALIRNVCREQTFTCLLYLIVRMSDT